MNSKIFIGKNETSTNPINDRHYQELLGLNPTLSEEISRFVNSILFRDFNYINKHELYDNSNLICDSEIEKAKIQIISILKDLTQGIDRNDIEDKKNLKKIIIIADKCFTNYKLLILLRKILGKENYNEYVEVVNIDYNKPASNDFLEDKLGKNNCLYLLGGSLSDTYSIDPSHYDSYLANIIKETSDDYIEGISINRRFLGICFGQQYLANIIGIANKNSSGIIATIKGPAQFAPSNCTIGQLDYVNNVYNDIFKGLSNNSTNSHFSAIFTRSGYVDFNLLKSSGNLGVLPLVTDDVSSSVVGWGSKNGSICGVQFHPELSFNKNKNTLRKELKKIVPYLSENKEEQNLFLNNFETHDNIKKDIGESFYVFAILGFLKDIQKSRNSMRLAFRNTGIENESKNIDLSKKLTELIANRVGYNIELSQSGEITEEQKINWIKSIDTKGRLLLNYMLDWKVNRSLKEIADILGINSILDLIEEHKIEQSKTSRDYNYIIRDLGAGDGNTIKELQNNIKGENVFVYGIGDYVYFDLFSAISNSEFGTKLPKDLIILFVEKVIEKFKNQKDCSTIKKIESALKEVSYNKEDKIHNSSMSGQDTYMFADENETNLTKESKEKFDYYLPVLEELKEYVQNNLFNMFSGFFQKIYIAKFNDLNIEDDNIGKVDFQYAIRSTSHVNGREYMQVIKECVYKLSKNGSIYIDNGVHQSYTSIPRLKELQILTSNVYGADFRLIYDSSTNYFCSLIIIKGSKINLDFWQKHLKTGHKIVNINEAAKSTFFRLEYFLRNFILANFKDHIVFWDFNREINDTLINLMKYIKCGNKNDIPTLILVLINYIAKNFKNTKVSYNQIDMSILNSYDIDGEKLSDIISAEIYIPEWMEFEANRK